MILVERRDVRGGETRVFEADGPRGLRFVMQEPWSAVLLDDARVIHESTPIQPDGGEPHRDPERALDENEAWIVDRLYDMKR